MYFFILKGLLYILFYIYSVWIHFDLAAFFMSRDKAIHYFISMGPCYHVGDDCLFPTLRYIILPYGCLLLPLTPGAHSIVVVRMYVG